MEDRFREQLRVERGRRGWSQADVAQMLSDKGIPAYPTTIAKIEAGDRAVKIDEATGIADLFGVSLDRLLGRNLDPNGDLIYTLRGLLGAAQEASSHVAAFEAVLRDRAAELAAFEFEERDDITADTDRACDALAKANEALRKVLRLRTDGAVSEAAVRMALDELITRIAD
jgi:transcriptional regulator with XRE-family HTH domain